MPALIQDIAHAKNAVGRAIAELELHDGLLNNPSFFIPRPCSRLFVSHEFDLRGARPDVCVADVDDEIFEARRSGGFLPCFSAGASAIVTALRIRRGPAAMNDLLDEAAMYVGLPAARRGLQQLRREDVVAVGHGVALASAMTRCAVHQVVAVEAKIGRWRAAAQQAHRWRLAVDEAWLALPASYVGNLSLDLPGLKTFGIVGIDAEGRLGRALSPPSRRADRLNKVLTEQYVFSRWLDELDLLDTGLVGLRTMRA